MADLPRPSGGAWGSQIPAPILFAAALEAFGDPDAAEIATAVALAESGGRMVVNYSGAETPGSLAGADTCASYGPWQINYCPTRDAGTTYRVNATRSDNPVVHAHSARAIYDGQGWSAWTMYANGGWQSYRGAASRARGDLDATAAALHDAGTDPKFSGQPKGTGDDWWSRITGNLGTIVAYGFGDALGGLFGVSGGGQIAIGEGAVSDLVGDGIGTVWQGIQSFAEFQLAIARWVANPDNWRRLGIGVAGVALVVVGLVIVFRDTATGVVLDAATGGLGGVAADALTN